MLNWDSDFDEIASNSYKSYNRVTIIEPIYTNVCGIDKPESSREQRVMGNVIGYAHRNSTYAGSDTQCGTINHLETKFEITDSKIRTNFVFDFPTHSANGITQSLYFCEAEPTYFLPISLLLK